MIFHRTYVNTRNNEDRPVTSPFGLALRHAAGSLITLAMVCILLGIGVLLFPLILAVFVACIFFFVALVCLGWAWRIYRTKTSRHEPAIHVTVSDADDDEDILLP